MPDPTVRDLLLADLDELVAGVGRAFDAIEQVTDQLHPERARSCRIAIAISRAMLLELTDRAHALPIGEDE